MRRLIERDPFLESNRAKLWQEQGLWPCSWIACPGVSTPPFVTAFRRCFEVEQDTTLSIHVAADERYDLYLDGEWIGRGNERGAPDCWFYETYEISLAQGKHALVARV